MSRLGVLSEPQFRRYYLAQTTSWLGDGLLPVAIAFAVLDLTGSASDLGLVLGVRIVPLLSSSWPVESGLIGSRVSWS